MSENPNKMIAKKKVVIFMELAIHSEKLLCESQYARFIDFGSLNRKQCFETLNAGQ